MMMPEVAARMFNTPLALHRGKADLIFHALGPRVLGSNITINNIMVEDITRDQGAEFERGPRAGLLGDRLGASYAQHGVMPYPMVDNCAVIGVEGSLAHKGSYIGKSSGVTSYEGINAQINTARADTSVKGVVLEVDSFGGEVAGMFDCGENIHDLSLEKPVIAICTDFAYSAAYLLAAAAGSIVISQTGGVGSIGVITQHVDYSVALEKSGIKVTTLMSGAHKDEGNPTKPLPDDVAEKIIAELDATRAMFAEAIGRYRGNKFTAKMAMESGADTYTGKDAVKAGLADAMARPSVAFAQFLQKLNT